MNWTNIKTKYPKAFDKAQKWWADNNTALVAMPEPIHNSVKTVRDLFPFFDEQGIYGSVYHKLSGGFKYDVQDDGDFLLVGGNTPDALPTFKIRTEAEEEMFEKEFEILENKLKTA